MAIPYTIQCDGVTTSFTIARAITTKESISLTIASGASAGTTVSGSDFTFSPVNNTAQSVTITWANAVNYGTVSVPVDVTVAVYHNPGADAADSLLYSYDSASAMRFEMVGRDLEHIIEYLKMVIGGADLATTSLGDQEDAIDALDVRLDAAEATITTHTSQITALDTRLDTAESDIVALEAQTAATATSGLKTLIENAQDDIAALAASLGAPIGLPPAVASVTIEEVDSASPLQILAVSNLGVLEYIDLIAQITKQIALAAVSGAYARWAGGARIQGGIARGDLYTTGTPIFKEGNFIDGTNVPTATEFASYHAGGTALHIYPPTGTDNTDYVVTLFGWDHANDRAEAYSTELQWVTDHWLYDSTDAPIAIYFLRVT